MASKKLLDDIKEDIGEKEYNKIINSPVKSCACGFIKEGEETLCPKCELNEIKNK